MQRNHGQSSLHSPSQTQFVRDSSLFSISLVLVGLCSLIRSFIIAKLLGPQGFGTWRFVNIFLEYLSFASLGTQPAMNQQVPFLRGQGALQRLQAVLRTVGAVNVYSAFFYSVMVFAWSFLVAEAANAKALAVFAPVIWLFAWLHYAKEYAIATEHYGLRRRLEVVHALTTMLLSVVLVPVWGVYGAIAGLGVATLLALGISARQIRQHLTLHVDWGLLWNLMRLGIPIMVDFMLVLTMTNVDRILIATMLSRETLGIYSVGNAGVSIMGTIPSALGQMLFVKFAEMEGQQHTKAHMAAVLDRTTMVLSILFAPILVVTIAVFPLVVVCLLPQYVAGIAAGQLLIGGVFFLGSSLPVSKWCVSTGRSGPVLVLRLVVVAAEFAVLASIIHHGASLEAIALCILSTLALFNLMMLVIGHALLAQPVRVGLVRAGKSFLPYLSIITVLWVQHALNPGGASVLNLRLWLSCGLGLAAGFIVSLPSLYWANQQTQVVGLLTSLLRRRARGAGVLA